MNPRYRAWLAWGAALAVFGLPGAPPAVTRADTASEFLARYNEKVDLAIDRALAFLAKNQRPDGSFQSKAMPGNTAITALSIRAMLSKGYTPGAGPYGDVIDRGIDYVLSQQQKNGLIVASRGRSHGRSRSPARACRGV